MVFFTKTGKVVFPAVWSVNRCRAVTGKQNSVVINCSYSEHHFLSSQPTQKSKSSHPARSGEPRLHVHKECFFQGFMFTRSSTTMSGDVEILWYGQFMWPGSCGRGLWWLTLMYVGPNLQRKYRRVQNQQESYTVQPLNLNGPVGPIVYTQRINIEY